VTDGRRDVLVLGAGIAGAALASHLARRSASVTVLDPRTPAAGASGRAAGIVTEQLWNEWDVRVARESREEYRALAAARDPEAFRDCPFVRVTAREDVAAGLLDALTRLRGWSVPVEEVSADRLLEWFPGGKFGDVRRAIASRSDACVTPSTITSLYLTQAREAGADVVCGGALGRPERDGDGWTIDAAGTTVRGRALVVAAGAWSKALLGALGAPLPLTPYRTQAATLRPAGDGGNVGVSLHDLDTDVYARPEGPGRILAGDGTESVEADPERFVTGGDPEFLAHLAASLGRWVPAWGESEVVGSWAGVCTATPDRRPCIGPIDPARSLYALTGFNGFGVMRAGGSARRLAELLLEPGSAPARAALTPVLPERFGGRADPFPPRPGFTLEAGDAPRF
jgi:sarcosine oxidase subunit beta